MTIRKTAILYLDVVTENLAVPFGSSLAQSLASLTTARHPVEVDKV